jgi:hypothetical protein
MAIFETGANVGFRSYKALTDASLARSSFKTGPLPWLAPPKIRVCPKHNLLKDKT